MFFDITRPIHRHVFRNAAWTLLVAATGSTMAVRSAGAQGTSSLHQQAERLRQAGVSQATAGHTEEAISDFKKGLEVEPGNAALLEATGAVYGLNGELETARDYFVASLNANPDSIATRQNLAIVLFSLGDYEDAAQQFSRLQDVPGKPRAIASLFLGLIARRRTDCQKAIPLMEASGDLLYQYPEALLSYSECEYSAGDTIRAKQALAAFDKLEGSNPQQQGQAAAPPARLGLQEKGQSARTRAEDSVLEQAAVLERAKRVEDAEKLLHDEAAVRPTFDVLFALAEIAKQRGDFAVAMKSLKRAADVEPGREDSYLEFSTICSDHGNDQLALDSAEIGLDHVPNSYRLTVQKGVVQEKLGHLNDAEETLKRAIGMQKDDSVALASLAVVQAHAGRPDEAEETLALAIRQFPDNYYMHYFRGKLLLHAGNTSAGLPGRRDLARHSLEKAIRLNPSYADAYYQLSDVYMDISPKLAEQALQKCLQLEPSHIPAQYALARLFVRSGRKAEAQAMFARLKGQQREEELKQQKQLRIEVAQD